MPMGPMPDLTPIFYLAMVGLAAIVLTAIGGGAWLIWFIINHVRIV